MEILAPAGNFQIAIAALNAGADAIYCGLDQFSARKSAKNLTKDELSRVKTLAREKNAKIFITLNTLIKDQEIPSIFETLNFLQMIEIDAIIIQDFGLLHFIKLNFPKLTVHASTQMAIHNIDGAKIAKKLGISRVVLARELTFEEITTIKIQCPDLEYECFIHGALCYSVSGMCLASGILLNRSGNRGECAQICRSYFNSSESNLLKESFCFSCNDLAIDHQIEQLLQIGIDSFKIEGRMKDANYVCNTIKYYKAILNKLPKSEIELYQQKSQLRFSRKKSIGYFDGKFNNLIGNLFPGHQGISIGKIVEQSKNSLVISLSQKIEKNDTLMYFANKKPIRFQAFCIEKAKEKNQIKVTNIDNLQRPDKNEIFLIQRGKSIENKIDYKQIKPFKQIITIDAEVISSNLLFKCKDQTISYQVTLEPSENNKLFDQINIQLRKNNDSFFYFQISEQSQDFFAYKYLSRDHIKDIAIFIWQSFGPNIISNDFCTPTTTFSYLTDDFLSLRENISPNNTETPFIPASTICLDSLAVINDQYFLPLRPFDINFDQTENNIKQLILQNPDKRFCLGINNIAHLKLLDLYAFDPNITFFVDLFFYCANNYTLDLLSQLSDKIEFIYSPVEFNETHLNKITIKNKKVAPIFISRSCFFKQNNLKSCPQCNHGYNSQIISNGKNKFKVISEDCITYLFLLS